MSSLSPTAASSFAAELRAKRERESMSQDEAARALGMTTRSYQAYEAGVKRKPRPATLRRIREWLGEAA